VGGDKSLHKICFGLAVGRKPFSSTVIPRNSQYSKPLRRIVLFPFKHRRKRFYARSTPRGPKIQQYDFSLEVGKYGLISRKAAVDHRKFRRRFIYQFVMDATSL